MASYHKLSFLLVLLSFYCPHITITVSAEIGSTRESEPGIGLPLRTKDQHSKYSSCSFQNFETSCDPVIQALFLDHVGGKNYFTVKSAGPIALETWLINDPSNCPTRNLFACTCNHLPPNTSSSPCPAVFNHRTYFISLIAGRAGDHEGSMGIYNSTVNFKSTSTFMLVMASIVEAPIERRPLALISVVSPVTEEELISKYHRVLATRCLKPECRLQGRLCGLESKDNSCRYDQVSCYWHILQTGSGRKLSVPLPILIVIILLVCAPSIICCLCSVWKWIRSVNNSGESPSSISTVRARNLTIMGDASRPNQRIQSNICLVCHSEFLPNEILRTMSSCQHQFHEHCVDRWLRDNNTCPICRTLVDSD